jgi:hypothetical protein
VLNDPEFRAGRVHTRLLDAVLAGNHREEIHEGLAH